MTSLARSPQRLAERRPRITVGVSTWGAVLLSRALVMLSAAIGFLVARSNYNATMFDPTRVGTHLGRVGSVIAASMVRGDANQYLEMAQHGYTTASSTAFFPLYPLLIRAVGWLTRSDVVAGALISAVCFAVALELLHRLARAELDEPDANAAVLLLAFAPLSLFFTALYTESLFLALSVATFYLARQGRLLPAGLTAGAAALAHIEGVLLVVPLAFCWWERRGRPRDLRQLAAVQAMPVFLPVVSLTGLFVFLHARGYGWIAPISNQTDAAWHHQFVGPVIGVIRALTAGTSGLWQTLHGTPTPIADGSYAFSPEFQSTVYLVVLVVCAAALVQAWRRLPPVYTVYSGLYLVILTSSPAKGDPLASFDRFALMLFPLWIAAASWLRERSLLRATIQVGAVLLLFYSFEFGRWVFIA